MVAAAGFGFLAIIGLLALAMWLGARLVPQRVVPTARFTLVPPTFLREEPLKAPPRPYAVARLSPDGTRVALDVRDQSNDIWIWIWDVGRQTLTPLNVHPAQDMSPLWTPDGRRVIWTSSRGGGNPNVFWQSADGTGASNG